MLGSIILMRTILVLQYRFRIRCNFVDTCRMIKPVTYEYIQFVLLSGRVVKKEVKGPLQPFLPLPSPIGDEVDKLDEVDEVGGRPPDPLSSRALVLLNYLLTN